MKTNLPILIYLLLLFLIPSSLLSQSPQSIPYQAVVRNTDGTVMSNAALTMIFKIHDQSAIGTVVYQESHSVTSNVQGLVICNVGNGTPTQGTFANINWGNGAKFLHVLMDAGNGELDLGTQQMMSVPYALYAEKSGSSVPAGSTPGELMYWNGEGWSSIPPGGYGQTLFLCDGVPTWGGCVPKLDLIEVLDYQILQQSDDTFRYLGRLSCELRPGVLSMNYWENVSGFYVSQDSTFNDNVIQFSGIAQLNSDYNFNTVVNDLAQHYFLTANVDFEFSLASVFYIRAYCQNIVGVGFSETAAIAMPSSVITGCRNIYACNYNSNANMDNFASCLFIDSPCDDNNPNTINDFTSTSCVCEGEEIVNGCTNPQACNFNALANVEDGSCLIQGTSCDDGNANTNNDVINGSCVCAGTQVNGSQLLPGNATCATQNISVTGCGGQTSLTYDGRTYDLVEIGGQCWFADNLATDQYRNGDPIPTGFDNATWNSTTIGAYDIYNNDPANDATYGKLYNWYTTVDSRGLCPTGWHVPTDCEWMYLEGNLGMSVYDQQVPGSWRGMNEGMMLKSISNWLSNDLSNNSSGFNAFPSGTRWEDGIYDFIGISTFFWTNTTSVANTVLYRVLRYDRSDVFRNNDFKQHGFSVRCLKD